MKRISLITVYNNQQLLNEMIASAKKQRNVDIEYVMIDNMRRMTPGILDIKDSYKEDDKRMLEIMKAFNAYDDMCMAYFYNIENQTAIDEYNKWMGAECKSVGEGVQHGFFSFLTL